MIVTIDGRSGQGKSTAGKRLAERAGFEFFSSGLLVRYAACMLYERRQAPLSPEEIVSSMSMADVTHADISSLRRPELIPYLKKVTDSKWCVEHLYEILKEYCIRRDIIIDGRDAFLYFPEAPLRYFFESTQEQRVALRMRTTGESEEACRTYIERRDAIERDIHVPFDELIVIHPLTIPFDTLIERMYADILHVKG